jgi:methylated-DNA-protein-cysteine methyltransferase-like protein
MSDFYEKVYALVRKIPKGRAMSYGDIAEYLGTKGSARTVGYAMNHAHTISPAVPAHRVVNRNGLLTGKHHFGSPTMMQQLLENEGIIILDDQIQDFEKIRWLPKKRNPSSFNNTKKIHDLHRGFSFLFGWFIEKLQLILQLQL